jgi:hypothetical protein
MAGPGAAGSAGFCSAAQAAGVSNTFAWPVWWGGRWMTSVRPVSGSSPRRRALATMVQQRILFVYGGSPAPGTHLSPPHMKRSRKPHSAVSSAPGPASGGGIDPPPLGSTSEPANWWPPCRRKAPPGPPCAASRRMWKTCATGCCCGLDHRRWPNRYFEKLGLYRLGSARDGIVMSLRSKGANC